MLNECPECGEQMKTVVGDRADLSYGEYLECPECGYNDGAEELSYEDNMTDVEADADTLRSCGWGTDEDYGYASDVL